MTGIGRCGAAVGFVLFPPSKMRSTNQTLQQAHAGTKIHNIFNAQNRTYTIENCGSDWHSQIDSK
tara:strand:- start:109 stop:303 length:195 start_codon:yes stop_codon:yes gene_type:complete